MNLKIVLPILAVVISTFALAENLVMCRVLLSGSDSAFIAHHHYMKHRREPTIVIPLSLLGAREYVLLAESSIQPEVKRHEAC